MDSGSNSLFYQWVSLVFTSQKVKILHLSILLPDFTFGSQYLASEISLTRVL